MNGDTGLEFLRFGSSIPGNYWGCCACCIIQNFKVDPDAKASIQLVSGDGGGPIVKDGKMLFAGPTYRDIFNQRLRVGTFGTGDMPNHAFIAILTDWQLKSSPGNKWLPILKEAGFEFVRTVSNSVYAGNTTVPPGTFGDQSPNYIFMLVRNVGSGAIKDQFMPPAKWTALDRVVPEAWEFLGVEDSNGVKLSELPKRQQEAQLAIWNKIGPAKFMTEEELVAAGAPVILAGLRSDYHRPQLKASREALDKAAGKSKTASLRGEAPEPEEAEDFEDNPPADDYSGEPGTCSCGDPACTFGNFA
jgi:hypothetical protein